ncbi:MAG TPA: redox-regulated ATPase YchF, partial [Planctomycetaceae bacterium]|nr:redox-regulated ATPase YchF [Planctomycetaceae bacterium]
GNPARLAQLREADALVVVAAAFDGADPAKEVKAFRDDLVLADLEIVSNGLEKVREQNKRPVPKQQHEIYEFEIDVLETIQQALESNMPLRDIAFREEQQRICRGFRLMNRKPWMVLVNTPDDEADPARIAAAVSECVKKQSPAAGTDAVSPDTVSSDTVPSDTVPVLAVSCRLEQDLAKMTPEERVAFLCEMELVASDRDAVLRRIMDVSGQMLFLTAGEKEVRTWLVRKGGTALDAAGEIHTDMAKGFIRAEVTKCDDLVRLGGERAVKAENLVRREPKDYVIQEGDVLLFHFSG